MPPVSDEEAVLVEAMLPATPNAPIPAPIPVVVAAAAATAVDMVVKEMPAPVVEKTATAVAHRSAGVLGQYNAWVMAHTGLARNLETMLYIAPQLVPKTAVEPEVATQTGYSLVGLLHLYHDYVLYKSTQRADAPPATALEQLTRAVRVPLSLLTHTQVLAEVLARKVGGEVAKWRMIVWIEVIKSVLRLILLAQTRKSLLLKGGKYKGAETSPQPSAFARFKKSQTNKAEKRGARTGKTFATKPNEPAPVDAAAAAVDKTPNTVTFEDPVAVVDNVTRSDLLVTGEFLHIVRPVAYALLRLRRPETSWTPVLVAFVLEASGLWLSNSALKSPSVAPAASSTDDNKPAPTTSPSQLVQDELKARKMALLLYFLRDPVYASVTQPATSKVCDVLDYVPVAGRAVRFASTAIMNYYHQFHFYTSAS